MSHLRIGVTAALHTDLMHGEFVLRREDGCVSSVSVRVATFFTLYDMGFYCIHTTSIIHYWEDLHRYRYELFPTDPEPETALAALLKEDEVSISNCITA